jgi:hypothetical protein
VPSASKKNGGKSLLSEIAAGLVGLPIVVTALLLIEMLIGHRPMCYFFLAAFALFTAIYLGFSLHPDILLKSRIERDLKKGDSGDFFLVGLPLLYFTAFVLLCRTLWLQYGAAAFHETPESPGLVTWVVYSADCLLGVVLFDAPEIYGFKFTTVEHHKTFWMSTLVFVYKATLAIGFIKILVISYSRIVLGKATRRGVWADQDAAEDRSRQ